MSRPSEQKQAVKPIAAAIYTGTQEGDIFSYGDVEIAYTILRQTPEQERRLAALAVKKAVGFSRSIKIKVHPDQRVVATVPHDATRDLIRQAMLQRARWIWKNIREFALQQADVLPKEYVSGETQFYLGRRYMLKVVVDDQQASGVKLSRGKLLVTLRSGHKDQASEVQLLLERWYLQRAKIVFDRYLDALYPRAPWLKTRPSFRIMAMKKQWGSCSNKGTLIFNPHLIKAPRECIQYVIVHELCHIAEHNHSEKFWCLLTQVMPDWKAVKAQLDAMAELYLNA